MANFDLVLSAGQAYQKTWQERHYLFRMGLIPLFIKFICYGISLVYVGPENILRLSLIMLPAYFAEGWFLSHWARTVITGHRWPFKPSGDDQKDLATLNERGRGILSGTVAFTLINLLMAGYFAFFMTYIPLDIDPETADPKIAMIGLAMIVSTVLLFRYIWVYIALAINVSIKTYVDKLKPIMLTFNMIGLWLVCFIPSVLLLQLTGGILANIGGDETTEKIVEAFTIFARVFLDMVKNLICTAGMAYAFIVLFEWKVKK